MRGQKRDTNHILNQIVTLFRGQIGLSVVTPTLHCQSLTHKYMSQQMFVGLHRPLTFKILCAPETNVVL